MTTIRPQIVRADTLDLQDQDAPSAKDHTRQPTHPAPLGVGPPAPHQSQTLKHVEQEEHDELLRSPRVSDDHAQGNDVHDDLEFYDDHEQTTLNGHISQDGQAMQDNGSLGGTTAVEGEVEGDEGLDDDMMDKISSSPSIDDGGYSLPEIWPSRADSLSSPRTRSPLSSPSSLSNNVNSSSPFLSTPRHFPLSPVKELEDEESDNHHQGGYLGTPDDVDSSTVDHIEGHRSSEEILGRFMENFEDDEDDYHADLAVQDIHRFLLPVDDPLLDNSFDDVLGGASSESSSSSWEDEDERGFPDDNNDDDSRDISFSDDPRFIDSGWGGECLREVEDIDFEFVYALHTFVATVEGQANATKGDTMVLLDDSNSYWWLVRVVKDGSIGYLPAEHIETPTERLARLNKHRNIDLSATMLGDNPEKSKNPLKKAMRRRNAKTVQFSAPTYFEPSDVDYSSEEEIGEGEVDGNEEETAQAEAQNNQEDGQQDAAVVEPLRLRTQPNGSTPSAAQQTDASEVGDNAKQESPDKQRTSDEMFDRNDGTSAKSRNGIVRNTDSFFKDDSVETKKISLTPNLLRDDSANANGEPRELKTRGSLETFEKITSLDTKNKDDKKRKEKKPGMLSGLFKRKDKKTRTHEDDPEDPEKTSEELRSSPQPKESSESLSQEARFSKPQNSPQRTSSKLQKPPPASLSPVWTDAPQRLEQQGPVSIASKTSPPMKENSSPTGPSARQVASEPPRTEDVSSSHRVQSPEKTREQSLSPSPGGESKPKSSIFSPLTTALKSDSSSTEPKPQKAKKASSRFAIEDSESEEDVNQPPAQTREAHEEISMGPERLSESPVHVSPIDNPSPNTNTHTYNNNNNNNPPGLIVDTSSHEEPSPVSPPSSPELIEASNADEAKSLTPASTATSTPTWSDASLRTYLEDESDIRDLLIIVHDKSNVVPAGPDHPITGGLFKEESRRLGELSNRLDGMLGDWMARKSALPPPK